MYDYSAGLFQRHDRYLAFGMSGAIRNIALPMFALATFWSGAGIVCAFSVLLLLQVSFFAIFDLRLIRKMAEQRAETRRWIDWLRVPPRSEFGPYLRLSTALTGGVFLSALNTSIPRFSTRLILGTTQVGLLTALSQFGLILMPALNGLAQALLPRLGRSFHLGATREFVRAAALLAIAALACGGMVALVAVSPWAQAVVKAVLGEQFVRNTELFFPISAMAVTSYYNAAMGPVLVSQRQYQAEFIQNFVVCVMLITTTVSFGLTWGLSGVIWGVVLCQATRAAWLTLRLARVTFFRRLPAASSVAA